MLKTLFVQPRASIGRAANTAPVRALSCVWIETGNPRQPVACVWIDAEVRAFAGQDRRRQPQSSELTPGDDPAVPLIWGGAEMLCA